MIKKLLGTNQTLNHKILQAIILFVKNVIYIFLKVKFLIIKKKIYFFFLKMFLLGTFIMDKLNFKKKKNNNFNNFTSIYNKITFTLEIFL